MESTHASESLYLRKALRRPRRFKYDAGHWRCNQICSGFASAHPVGEGGIMKSALFATTRRALALVLPIVLYQSNLHAEYHGLGVRAVNGGGGISSYRVYAVFTDPNDYLIGAGGSSELGQVDIQSLNFNGSAPGSVFYQNPAGEDLAPTVEAVSGDLLAEWDTFATIGTTIDDGSDATMTSPGFPTFINGTQLTGNFWWSTDGAIEQGWAGGPNGGFNTFVNTAISANAFSGYGVPVMQLTVNTGSKIRGTIALEIQLAGALSGTTILSNQKFSTVPAPAALGVLMLAASVGRPRRRTR
jgi:hypothetical protein